MRNFWCGARLDDMVGEEHGDGNAQQVMHPSFLRVLEQKKRVTERLAGIKHKICIYSAKGGVGKTTVAVNLAYALRAMGYSGDSMLRSAKTLDSLNMPANGSSMPFTCPQ